LSIERRRTETVYGVIQELFEQGRTAVQPGDVSDVLRQRGAPLGAWEIRAELSNLEAQGRLTCDEDTANWHLTESSSLKHTG